MKQLYGAVCAMVIALGGLSMAPAQAQQRSYRDHEGWYGTAPATAPVQMAVRPAATTTMAAAAAAKKPAARRWTAPKRRWTRTHWTAPARSYRTYRQVWFGNKVVWWPVNNTAPVARPRATRTSSWRYASWRQPYARNRWSAGHRVYWHPGYWSTDTRPGTMTPEPVYRYNPNGANPSVMNAPPAAKPASSRVRVNSKQYPGYQYYYYGKPVTSARPGARPQTASRPQTRANAAAAPKDNIPTVYLYQRGHRQGIHLPPATPPAAEATPAPAGAPGAPGAPGVPGAPAVPPAGGLIPGAAPAPGGVPGAAPGAAPVPPAPQVPAKP